MKKIIWLLIWLPFGVNITVSAQNSYDLFRYREPSNTQKIPHPNYVEYQRIDQANNSFCLMTLHKSMNSLGSLNADAERSWLTLVSPIFANIGTPNKLKQRNNGIWEVMQSSKSANFNGAPVELKLYTFSNGRQTADVMIVYNHNSHVRTMNDLLSSLSLNNGTPPTPTTRPTSPTPATRPTPTTPTAPTPATPTPVTRPTPSNMSSTTSLQGTPISGVWMTFKANLGSEASYEWRVFFGNGKSLDNLPNQGLYGYDVNGERNRDVGTYTFRNNSGHNRKSSVDQYGDQLALLSSDQLKIDNDIYKRCASVNGTRLAGSFTSFANPHDPSLRVMPLGNRPVITFSRDGRFKDEGVFNTYAFDRETNPSAARSGSGTYEFRDFSVILKYDDGRMRQESFNVIWSNSVENASTIFIRRMPLQKM